MSQIIMVQNANGIVLAADGKGEDFDAKGNLVLREQERIFPLGTRAAVLAGGVAAAAEMAANLQRFVKDEGLEDVDDVYAVASAFLASQYQEFMRHKCETLPLDPLQQVHFIIAGGSRGKGGSRFRAYLLWNRKKQPQLDGEEIGLAYTVPRRLGLEYRLGQAGREGASLEELLFQVRAGLEKLAVREEEVRPPLGLALIDAAGFRRCG